VPQDLGGRHDEMRLRDVGVAAVLLFGSRGDVSRAGVIVLEAMVKV